MATQVVMPKLSPTMEEGQLSRWLKKEGDKVSMGEPLAEIDTDKATMEMQSLANGVLLKILVNEGDSAPLGDPIAIVGAEGEDISDLLGAKKSAKEEAPAAKPKTEEAEEKEPEPKKAEATSKPSGPPKEEEPKPVTTPSRDDGRQLISPIAARMAAEAGINLKSLQGSGPGGRIVKRDVEEAVSGKVERIPTAPRLRAVPARPLEKGEVYPPSAYRDEPASEMRRTIAKRLVTSLGPVPHFFLTTEIDMERAADLRGAINELYPDAKISINDVIIKVAAAALIQHPQVNASFQDKNIRYYEHADIGVAVATENGLITPVVRSADLKSMPEIGAEVRELAERARARKLKPEEYMGATFSISNLGMFGIDEFTAVINPPEGAILAIGAAAPKPVVHDGQIVIRQTMRVTMSCDHRVVDGAIGAKFLQTFKQIMENPLYLFLSQ
ncbi:MAG: pyruvate dehydrogenase complex dihydrolipoamide acetyltransferase [Acidobacteria bacterium]|nr:MAG: pyruvate dehydrogenase complex dihydrolipoamide acetyltransferase [Acidobacteriota bacterium]PYS63273.1 MAG: pyruvate dehydrogenase complex dihydrolipoamide acetyltransferase [Acidobacteriota bacterium]